MKAHGEIIGWFGSEGMGAYRQFVREVPYGGTIVECGAWLGRSSAFLCDIAKKDHKIFIIDHWLGSEDERETFHIAATYEDLYSRFLENMGDRNFTPLKGDATELSKQFEDNSIDLVIIDMEHTYEAVKNDIRTWLPKVKDGGYLIGDDYNEGWFPGVVRAVNELLPERRIHKKRYWAVRKGHKGTIPLI